MLATVQSSFKALKQPKTRQRRAGASIADVDRPLTSAERMRRRKIKVQLTNFVVLVSQPAPFAPGPPADPLGDMGQACFFWVEKVADRTVGWVLPLYDEMKVIVLLSILIWRSIVHSLSLVIPRQTADQATFYDREPNSSFGS